MGDTTIFTAALPPSFPGDDPDWYNAANWSAGVPGLGSEVRFSDQTTGIWVNDVPAAGAGKLELGGNKVILGEHTRLDGDHIIAWNSNIIAGDNVLDAQINADLTIDTQSFVGSISYHANLPTSNATPPRLAITDFNVANYGDIGAVGATASVSLEPRPYEWHRPVAADNHGNIIAVDGGSVYLHNVKLTQFDSGQISMQTGGMMFLDEGTSINSGTINFGGQAGTSLSLDTNSVSLQASLSHFDLTDTIDLQGLIATGIKETGTVNPTLQISGANAHGIYTQTLSFNGDYSGDTFHTMHDAAGTGTLVYVTSMTVAHPPGQIPPHVPGIGGLFS